MWPRAAALRHQAVVQRVARELDHGVAKAAFAGAVVVFFIATGMRLHGGAEDRRAFGVEDAAQPDHAALAGLDR